jgi:hypothetical protein
MPGTYGSAAGANDPATATGYIDSSVGFMESVQGLGTSPGDVRINGNLRSGGPGQRALGYSWRSLTNMRINPIQADMPAHTMRWSTSQASPLRRLDVAGNLDAGGSESFGTELANSRVSGVMKSGNTWVADNPRELGQAHYYLRDSQIGSWSGRGANFVFSGVDGAPPTDFGNAGDKTTLPTTPVSRDAPFLYVDQGISRSSCRTLAGMSEASTGECTAATAAPSRCGRSSWPSRRTPRQRSTARSPRASTCS